MVTKTLIASRGQITFRAMTTARKTGIQTVALHAEADKEVHHVKLTSSDKFLKFIRSHLNY